MTQQDWRIKTALLQHRLAKFNPNHDEAGRFSSGPGGGGGDSEASYNNWGRGKQAAYHRSIDHQERHATPSKAAARGLKGLTKRQKSLHPRAQVQSLRRSAKILMGNAESTLKHSGNKAKAAEYGKRIADKMAAAEHLNRTHKLGYNVNLKQVERAARDLGVDISE